MRKLFLFAFVTSVSISLNSQNIDETIKFINTSIKESAKSAIDPLSVEQISVSETGKLTVDYYMNISGIGNTIVESRSAYLKSIDYSETKYVKSDDGAYYVVILRCFTGNCVSRQVKSQSSVQPYFEVPISIYNFQLMEKVRSALIRLVYLANRESDYLTKDPF